MIVFLIIFLKTFAHLNANASVSFDNTKYSFFVLPLSVSMKSSLTSILFDCSLSFLFSLQPFPFFQYLQYLHLNIFVFFPSRYSFLLTDLVPTSSSIIHLFQVFLTFL
uniref:Uncharacterized protein n=1 Tax=Cacopsylla melanoneura TaxID=428564 RepID=A0A8D8VS68_9HEMI